MTWLVLAGSAARSSWSRSAPGDTRTANRLNRLNVRYDLSWQSLDSAARRAVVARGGDRRGWRPPGQSVGRLSRRRGGRAPGMRARMRTSWAGGDGQPAAARGPDRRKLADAARVLLARRFITMMPPHAPRSGERRLVRLPAWWSRCAANLASLRSSKDPLRQRSGVSVAALAR